MRRSAVTPAINVGLHNSSRRIDVIAIDAGAMTFVFPDDLKATNRSAISFSTAGYAGGRGSVVPPEEIAFLLPKAHAIRCPAGLLLRQVGGDRAAHVPAAPQGRERC